MIKALQFLLFALVLGFFARNIWHSEQERKASLNWPSTTGRLNGLQLKEVDKRDTDNRGHTTHQHYYELVVDYSYSVGDRRFTGNRLRVGGRHYQNEPQARAALQEYDAKGRIEVFYDPQHPENSVLEPG